MKQIYNFPRGGVIPYEAPSIEIHEISVEKGFVVSPVVDYDDTEGTESAGSDSESTRW